MLALLGLVATQIDWDELRDALGEGSWWWFGAAVGTVALALCIGAFRWVEVAARYAALRFGSDHGRRCDAQLPVHDPGVG